MQPSLTPANVLDALITATPRSQGPNVCACAKVAPTVRTVRGTLRITNLVSVSNLL